MISTNNWRMQSCKPLLNQLERTQPSNLTRRFRWYRQIVQAFHQWSILDNIAKLSYWKTIQRRIEIILCYQPKNVRSFRVSRSQFFWYVICNLAMLFMQEEQAGQKSIYRDYKPDVIYDNLEEVTGNCLPYLLSFEDDLRKILRLRDSQAQSFADLLDWASPFFSCTNSYPDMLLIGHE